MSDFKKPSKYTDDNYVKYASDNIPGMIGVYIDSRIGSGISGSSETKPKAVPEVKRYERVFDEMIESSGGDYVLYSAYKEAIEKCAELEAENTAWKLKNDTLKWSEVESKIAELEDKAKFWEDQQTQNDVYIETLLMEIDRLSKLKP